MNLKTLFFIPLLFITSSLYGVNLHWSPCALISEYKYELKIVTATSAATSLIIYLCSSKKIKEIYKKIFKKNANKIAD